MERTQRERKQLRLMSVLNILLIPMVVIGPIVAVLSVMHPLPSNLWQDMGIMAMLFSPVLVVVGTIGFARRYRNGSMQSLQRYTQIGFLCPAIFLLGMALHSLGFGMASGGSLFQGTPSVTGDQSERLTEHFYDVGE